MPINVLHQHMKKCAASGYYDHDEHVEMSAFLDTLHILSFVFIVDDHAHNVDSLIATYTRLLRSSRSNIHSAHAHTFLCQ